MHSDHHKPTIPCSVLLTRSSSKSYTLDGAVGDTYLLPTQSVHYSEQIILCSLKLGIETLVQYGSYLPRGGGELLLTASLTRQKDLSASHVRPVTLSDVPQNKVKELGLAKASDTNTGLSQYVGQEAKRVCEASYGADGPVNVGNLDSLWWLLLK
ncbi:hypothetical protein EDD15DRAFT_2199544 [Pisolithus albus]|nr:hypothetical protein EDD15DRAFT_2199544 [Pisolithus albus]